MKKRSNLDFSTDYINWLEELKTKVRRSQLKAAVAVNQELLKFYWDLGFDIVEKQKSTTWGTGFLKQLSQDLMAEFPYMGFQKEILSTFVSGFCSGFPKHHLGNRLLPKSSKYPGGTIWRFLLSAKTQMKLCTMCRIRLLIVGAAVF